MPTRFNSWLPMVLCLGMAPIAIRAQTPLPIGEVFTFHSAVLAEQRTLNIALPVGYHNNDTVRYPVIFLLDGSADEDFIHLAGALQFASLSWIAWQHPSILVGIANTDRKRDFTFPTTIAKDKEQFPTTGGSEAFINFLSKELIPFIDDRFHTTKERMLIGQSLGGLLATEILFKQPALFQSYLIVSPSLWWDGGSLLKQPAMFMDKPEQAPAQVLIAVGKEGRRMVADARKLRATVRRSANTHVGFTYLGDFNHANILHRAVMDGFRWLGGK